MCNIAGYTGTRRAAPILIDMIRREQFIDGGLSTGIATIHEGKVYSTKILGDVDELLRTTDALNFPGTCGIIHSRPAGDLLSHAHPFLSENKDCAVVLNGTLRDVACPEFFEASHNIMQPFYDRGTVRSAYKDTNGYNPHYLDNGFSYHDTEVYALMLGEALNRKGATAENMEQVMVDAISALPADIVLLAIQAQLPGLITIGNITRPMCAGITDEETYLSTTALAFPEDISFRQIVSIPCASVAQVTPGQLVIGEKKLEGVQVEQISERVLNAYYERIEKILLGQKDDPKSIYDFPSYDQWRDVWQEPFVDCKFRHENGLLKPYATACYLTLWAFYQEGRLHGKLGERNGKRIVKFWLEN